MPSPKGVPVQLDKKRTFRFDWRALVKLEQETGLTSTEVYQRIADGSLATINAAIWAGLIHEDPELTTEDVLGMVDTRKISDVAEALSRALQDAMPEAADEEEGAPRGAEKKGPETD